MMRMRSSLAALLGASWLAGCLGLIPGLAGGGSGTEGSNGEIIAGQAVHPDGTPAVGARVFVRPAEYLADTSTAQVGAAEPDAITDGDGNFRFDSLRPGNYKVEIREEREGRALAVQQGFAWTAQSQNLFLAPDTLRPVSALQGRVELSPETHGQAFIQVYGFERLVPTDSLGYFIHPDLPAGTHRIRAVSRQPGFGYPSPNVALIDPGDTARLGSLRAYTFADENYADWPFTRGIAVNTEAAGIAGSVKDFPLLVRLDEKTFDFGLSDGKDLRFSAPDGKRLRFQMDFWDADARRGAFWVLLDSVQGNAREQALRMHWGKRDAPDFSDGKSVFASFAGTWHLSDAQGSYTHAQYRDASPANAYGDAYVTPENGVIGKAAGFKAVHWARFQVDKSMAPKAALTLSAWANVKTLDTNGGELASMGDNYGLRALPDGKLRFFLAVDTGDAAAAKARNHCDAAGPDLRGAWHQVAATYDGQFARVYVDGAEQAACPMEGTLAYPAGTEFFLGTHGYNAAGYALTGILDEIQVTGKVRSPEWIRMSRENQQAGSALVEFGN